MEKGDNNNLQDILLIGFGTFRMIEDNENNMIDYMILDVNSDFEKLTGYHRKNILGKLASEVFEKKTLGKFDYLSYWENVVRAGKIQETTQWNEETKRFLNITIIPSNHMFFSVIIRERNEELITENDSNDELAPTLEDLNIAFNSTHEAISLVEYRDDEFRYIRNNLVHQRIFGFSNVKEVSITNLFGDVIGGVLTKHFKECMNTGRKVNYEQRFDFELGKRVWETEVTPVFANGSIRYLLCTSKDISELKNVQEEKEILLKRLQSMFDRHTAIMMMIEPRTGKIFDANPAACEFYGYSKSEILSLNICDINILPPNEVKENRLMASDDKKKYFSAFPHRLKNGKVRLVDVFSSPIFDGENLLLYSIIHDVTDREVYRKKLCEEKELLLTTLKSIGDGVVTTDNIGIITSLNNVGQEITGWTDDEAIGKMFTNVFRLQNEETGELVENPIQKVLETGKIVELDNHTELISQSGKYTPIADSAAPIKTEDDKTVGVVMVFRDVSYEKEHNKQINYMGYHDSLTGLYNRRYIEDKMSQLDREENFPISIIMGDVNGLKLANDVFGHKAGDKLLQNVAKLLLENGNNDSVVARWGGDEFVVLMPRTSLRRAEIFIRNVRSNHITFDNTGLQLSISLGCAIKDNINTDIETVMRKAEEYMYHQKLLEGKSYRNAIINTLLETLYEMSNETEEHSKRLEKYCHAIGKKLQISLKEMNELSLLALLHDVGKVSISHHVLKKLGALTPEEWDEMKRHPEIGYRIAKATPELLDISEYILYHHERWDGKGYPCGLIAEKTPLVCRVLAVVDAFDAMTNDRVYRSTKSNKEAILELENNAGTQFDPSIVSIFVQILNAE